MMQGPGPPTPNPAGPPGPAPDTEQGQNALLPRSLFSDDVKPGDTITLKVSAIHGDEVEVTATAESETEPPESTAEPPEMTADEEIEAAAEQA
jgi:hypothetical protein